jgi:hypothetical protein
LAFARAKLILASNRSTSVEAAFHKSAASFLSTFASSGWRTPGSGGARELPGFQAVRFVEGHQRTALDAGVDDQEAVEEERRRG